MKKVIILLALAIGVLSLQAQKGKVELKLQLRDGNSVTGTSTSITTVDLITDYGKLTIPIKNVTLLKFGIIPDAASKPAVIKLINQLGDSDVDKRKTAYDAL